MITTQTFRRALTASVDSCVEIKSAPSVALDSCAERKSGVTKSGRVWRKVPESDARGVSVSQPHIWGQRLRAFAVKTLMYDPFRPDG